MSRSGCSIDIIGVHQIDVTPALMRGALDLKYGSEYSAENERSVEEEVRSARLFEVLVRDADEAYSTDDFGQPGSDQAAYMERYLSRDGLEVISEFDRPAENCFRVAFFLHFVEHDKPLLTSAGRLPIPAVSQMPDRLRRLAPYDPVT